MKKPMLSRAALKEFLWEKHRFWLILIAVFAASQAINIWAGMPDYASWDFVFGFPLAYLQWKNSDGFVYFNAIIFFIDALIVYLLLKAFFYFRAQMGRYQMPEGAKEKK